METKYLLSISEPWDFKGPDGPNIVTGTLLALKSKRTALFRSDHAQEFGKASGTLFLLTTRHAEQDFFSISEGTVSVNGSLLPEGSDTNRNEEQLAKTGTFVLIGSLKIQS